MNLPDFTALTLGQIAGYLFPLALLVFVTGFLKAVTSATVLWTYTTAWLTTWLGPAFVVVAIAAVGKGIPGLTEPNQLIGTLIFIPAVVAYVASILAAIAKNVGIDLSSLPFAKNAAAKFGTEAVKSTPTNP